MKLLLLSDLHHEVHKEPWAPEPVDVDVVVLAGDIGSHTHGLEWAVQTFSQWPSQPKVLYVAGNHEYYDASLDLLTQLQAPAWEAEGVTFLEQRSVEISGVRFLGCTLWSDFNLYGAVFQSVAMAITPRFIPDYSVIYKQGDQPIRPQDTLALHRKAVSWLDDELSKPFDGRTVVITHFAPHPQCVAPEHESSDLSPYFVTDLSWLMQKNPINLWCYGHTHTNTDFIAEHGCRVVSNQRGYPHETLTGRRPFDPGWIIEV